MEYIGFLFLFLGMVSRAVAPFLVLIYKDKLEFADWDWKFLRNQFVGTALVLVILPLLLGALEEVGGWSFREAWTAGWTAAAMTRVIEKLNE